MTWQDSMTRRPPASGLSDFPELPSDEELGIAGMELDEGEDRGRADRGGEGARGAGGGDGGRGSGGGSGPGGSAPGRRAAWTLALAALAVLGVAAWGTHPDRAIPAPVAANAPPATFSSARALTHLVELAQAPRPVGAPEHDRVRGLLAGWLEELGLETEIQTSVSLRRVGGGEALSAVTLRNVVARLPGERPPGVRRDAVLLTAHYDGVPLSHGAGDAGLGVVAIVETLRALQAARAEGVPPFPNDVLVLLTDGEEIGLLGARAFVASHRWMEDVRVVLSAEMRGVSGPVHMFETGAENGWIVRQMQAADPHPRAHSLYVEGYRRMPNDTDFTVFREAGVQGLNFAGVGGGRHYHEPSDRPGVVQESTLQHMGARLLALTDALGRTDLTEVRAPDRVFSTLPWVGIVSLPQRWALPLSLGVVLLWGLASAVALRRGRGGLAFLLGAGTALFLGGVAWVLGVGLLRVLPHVHPEFGLFTPLVDGEGRYALALSLGVATLFLAVMAGVARWLPLLAFIAGMLLPLALVVLGTGAFVPLVSLEFQIALAGAALGLLALAGMGVTVGGAPASPLPGRGEGPRAPTLRLALGGGLALLLALPVMAVVVPPLATVTDGLTLRMASLLGVLAALGASALAPAFVLLLAPGRGWAPAAGLVATALLVGVGLLRAGASDARPLPSTLIWTEARGGDGTGEPGGGEAIVDAGPETAAEARWLTREDPGFGWVEAAHGPFGPPEARPAWFLPGSWRDASAPAMPSLPRPEIQVVDVTPIGPAPRLPGAPAEGPGPSLRVAFALRSAIGAERIRLNLPDEAAIREVEGIRPPDGPEGSPGARRDPIRLLHQGRPQAEAGLHLVVEVPAGRDFLTLEVVEEHLRAPELLATAMPGAFTRPPGLQPSARGLSDRALIRTWISLPLGLLDPPAPGTRAGEDG